MHHRRSIRLKDYDYTQNGVYFVTICTHERLHLFGDVVDGAMVANARDEIVQSCWEEIPAHYAMVELDAFVVMPNHVHGLIVITRDDVDHIVGATHGSPLPTHPTRPNGPKRHSLGAIIGQFKSAVTRRINRLPNAPGHPIWQRNYYEHILRNEESLNQMRAYVASNPVKWAEDSMRMAARS